MEDDPWPQTVIYTPPYVPCRSAQTVQKFVESKHVVTKIVSCTTFHMESVLVHVESKLVHTDPQRLDSQ